MTVEQRGRQTAIDMQQLYEALGRATFAGIRDTDDPLNNILARRINEGRGDDFDRDLLAHRITGIPLTTKP